MCRLDYNELKRLLLRTLADIGPTNGDSLARHLNLEAEARFEIHAVRMALVRYYRQGLLRRVRTGGEFQYSLSARGANRLQWLESQARAGDE